MTNWDQESNTWKAFYVKCSLDPFFFIYRLESESEKNCVLNYKKNVIAEMVEAIMIADYRANVETSLSLARVKMIIKTYKLWWSWPKPLEDKLIINNNILNQDEVFHIMDSITRDRQECYVVRNSSVRLENCEHFYQLSLLKFLRGPSFKVNDRYCGWL